MQITKEQIIEWVRAAGAEFAELPMCDAIVFTTDGGNWHSETLDRFTAIASAAAYAKGQEDMRERAAKVCDDLERAKWESVSDIAQNKGRIAFAGPVHCATGIRALPIQKGGED